MPSRRPPDENQLALAVALPAARSARAELSDHAGRSGARKRALGGSYTSWPRLGEALVLLLPVHGADGPLEAELAGEFIGLEFDPAEGCNVGRVRLAGEQDGLSASLAASLPKIVSNVRLGMLRKRKEVKDARGADGEH